jgi:hypothetical protein
MLPKPTGGTLGGISATAVPSAPAHPNPVAPTHLPLSMDAWYEHFLGRKRTEGSQGTEQDRKLVTNQTEKENELIYFLALSEEYRQKYPDAKQFVLAIYKDILRRSTPPTDAEIAGHLAKLAAAGNTKEAREQILNDILGCGEYKAKPLLPPRPTPPQPTQIAPKITSNDPKETGHFDDYQEKIAKDLGYNGRLVTNGAAALAWTGDHIGRTLASGYLGIGDALEWGFGNR